MNSVERVKTYSEEVPQEDDDNDRLIDPSTLGNWPSSGKVEASGVELAYRDGPLVLKGISFKVAASEKIGIAGRTGSGE